MMQDIRTELLEKIEELRKEVKRGRMAAGGALNSNNLNYSKTVPSDLLSSMV